MKFAGAAPNRGPNYQEQVGRFEVSKDGDKVVNLFPAKRIYDAPRQATNEAGIYASWSGDLYVVLGDQLKEGGFAVRAYFNPFVRFIWIGTLIMFLGGGVSLADRRLRVGAPRPAKRPRNAVPAE